MKKFSIKAQEVHKKKRLFIFKSDPFQNLINLNNNNKKRKDFLWIQISTKINALIFFFSFARGQTQAKIE